MIATAGTARFRLSEACQRRGDEGFFWPRQRFDRCQMLKERRCNSLADLAKRLRSVQI